MPDLIHQLLCAAFTDDLQSVTSTYFQTLTGKGAAKGQSPGRLAYVDKAAYTIKSSPKTTDVHTAFAI